MFLEKSPFRGGGSSSINMGQWTCPHDADAAAQFAFEAFHGQTPMDVCQAWADEAVQNADYADKYGIEYTLGDSARAEYDFFTGFDQMYVGQGVGWGVAAFEVLDQHIKDRGIEILFDCHDEELIQDPITKEILGAYTLIGDDETKKAVKARKGVCLCTGGFEFNFDLQAKYLKCDPMRGFYGWKYNTGDGIGMVQKVGADLWHMQQKCGMRAHSKAICSSTTADGPKYRAFRSRYSWQRASEVTPSPRATSRLISSSNSANMHCLNKVPLNISR